MISTYEVEDMTGRVTNVPGVTAIEFGHSVGGNLLPTLVLYAEREVLAAFAQGTWVSLSRVNPDPSTAATSAAA